MMKWVKIILLVIILLSAILRFYKLDQIPPSLSWDEVASGYNAYTIANWGKDEWGKFFPSSFKSFEDDKHPVHIYLTALSVRLFGLSEFTTRLPASLFGVLYIVTPSQYDGLRYRSVFDVKKLIRYPDGSDAFYIVSVN